MKRRNGIKVGLESTPRKTKRENKVVLQIRLRPDLQEFIDAVQADGIFKTKTAVVESALDFLRNYMALQKESNAKYGLTASIYSDLNFELVSLLASPSDSA